MYNVFTMNTLLKSRINIDTKTNAGELVQTLESIGVDCVFGYPGAAVLSIYNELSKNTSIKHILVRHEQAALHAAEGYARTSGKVGVVLVTSGPGFTNTITGIANAYADSTPLIILAGDVSYKNKDRKIFQSVDILSMTKSCSKKGFMLSEKDDINLLIKEAFEEASSGVKGPVVIALPRNILEKEYTEKKSEKRQEYALKNNLSTEINKLSKLLAQAKKPLLLIGGGVVDSSKEVFKLVTKYKLPYVTTLMGIGVCPTDNPLSLGMIGMNGTYLANSALNHSDLIIALGVSFSDRSTCKNDEFGKKAKIVSINLAKISQDFELEINANAKEFLEQFLKTDNTIKSYSDWYLQIEMMRKEIVTEERKTKKLHSSYVLETLSKLTKNSEPIVVTDVGQHQMLTAQYFNFTKPRKFITSGGMGTMGFGLPASMGAYIANPDNLILNITGDGSFQMNLQELATCREHNMPIKIIIMNNGYLGMVRQIQEKLYKNTYQVEMTNPDFVKIAESYDLFSIRITKKEELVSKLEEALSYKGTAIVDIMTDSFEEI